MMKEKHRLRRIFGPKWDEVTGGWRKLHNESEMAVHVMCMEEMINLYKILLGRPEGRDHLT
jgi:hypothetical protein